jgi:hypothetical protein
MNGIQASGSGSVGELQKLVLAQRTDRLTLVHSPGFAGAAGWTIVSKNSPFRCQPEDVCLKMTEMTRARCHSTENYFILRGGDLSTDFNYILKHCCISERQSLTSCNVTNKR